MSPVLLSNISCFSFIGCKFNTHTKLTSTPFTNLAPLLNPCELNPSQAYDQHQAWTLTLRCDTLTLMFCIWITLFLLLVCYCLFVFLLSRSCPKIHEPQYPPVPLTLMVSFLLCSVVPHSYCLTPVPFHLCLTMLPPFDLCLPTPPPPPPPLKL